MNVGSHVGSLRAMWSDLYSSLTIKAIQINTPSKWSNTTVKSKRRGFQAERIVCAKALEQERARQALPSYQRPMCQIVESAERCGSIKRWSKDHKERIIRKRIPWYNFEIALAAAWQVDRRRIIMAMGEETMANAQKRDDMTWLLVEPVKIGTSE